MVPKALVPSQVQGEPHANHNQGATILKLNTVEFRKEYRYVIIVHCMNQISTALVKFKLIKMQQTAIYELLAKLSFSLFYITALCKNWQLVRISEKWNAKRIISSQVECNGALLFFNEMFSPLATRYNNIKS
ncbi:hypothetical protein NQ317_018645 [Molorchus minor]|uniref:Uncharacterized protein n=1 Tax=Molorchus minor TaxID=1323400 RepID=A0ABQ9JWQ1_9CUCU|nr:hypothetical protein NQ317_018645 [Molorchus minor]